MARVKKENELVNTLDIDKKAIVKEITKEIKESLDEEIIKKVDYESKNKLDKMERRIYRQKNLSLIRRDIIILLFLGLIVYETKILYDNGLLFELNKKESKEEVKEVVETKEETKEEDKKDLNWYIERYGDLLNNVDTNLAGDDKYYLYSGNYKENDIKNSVRLNMAYQLLDIKSNDGIYKISESDLKEAYKKIFGTIDNYKAENFNNDCISFIYNKSSESYMAIDTECTSDNTEIIRSIKNIYEDSDRIVIEVNVGVLDKENNTIGNIDSVEVMDNSTDNISKLDTYKFTFKDNYLYKITKE